jgi:glucose-1-phosphate adenylyltransferase
MRLLDDDPDLDLYDPDWVIHTRSEERSPKVGPTAQVHRSLISHGCVIAGTVVNSVLSPGVRVDVGAAVRDSIVMFDSVIRRARSSIARSSPRRSSSGRAPSSARDRTTTDRTSRSRAGHRHHGRRQARRRSARRADRPQCQIAADVRSSDFSGRVIRSGESVEPKRAAKAARSRAATPTAQVAVTAAPERPLVAAVVGGSGSRGKRSATDA